MEGVKLGRGGRMRFVVEDGDQERQGDGEEGQAQGAEAEGKARGGLACGKCLAGRLGGLWGSGKERRLTGTGGVAQGKVRREETAGEGAETTGWGTGANDNERRKSMRNERRQGEGRTMGGQRRKERGGYGMVRRGTRSREAWRKG